MRKIVSKYEAQKKKKRNQLIVGGVLIAVMLFSVLGYSFQNYIVAGGTTTGNSSVVTYNGINFVNQNGYWVIQSNTNRLVFTYNPSEINLMNLTSLTKTINDFKGKPLYIYSGGDLNAESEISLNMKGFASSIQDACPPGMICTDMNSTINADCSDNFIIIENGTSGVKQNENCIYISGNENSTIQNIDNVLFKILGIVK